MDQGKMKNYQIDSFIFFLYFVYSVKILQISITQSDPLVAGDRALFLRWQGHQ